MIWKYLFCYKHSPSNDHFLKSSISYEAELKKQDTGKNRETDEKKWKDGI